MMVDGATSNLLKFQHQAGVLLHIAALPGPYGIGELGRAARKFIDRMVDMQLGVWQFLPVGPTGYGDSPYQSFSTFAGNEMLIDIGNLIDLGMVLSAEAEDLGALPEDSVDYGALIPLKSRLLNLAASRFQSSVDKSVIDEFDQFTMRHNAEWLHDYALFRVIKAERNEQSWLDWPVHYRHRDRQAMQDLEETHAESIESVKIQQFLFFRQWAELRRYAHDKGVRLFGDMPIYIALDSADAWANRDLVRLDDDGQPDAVAGVPPDYYSEDGQLWGNPLYDWERHAANGFSWWIKRLQAAADMFDLTRIDHFRGFESYWAVPAGADNARVGAWEPGPGNALFQALRDSLGELPIVAEDLGMITPEVEALREDNQLPGMSVLQFAFSDDTFDASTVPENSVCYTGTHDNDTTPGWYHSGAANGDYGDLTKVALETKARLVVVPIQDFLGLGSEARYNVPGTASNNWRWRLQEKQLSPDFCHNVSFMVAASGRGIFVDE